MKQHLFIMSLLLLLATGAFSQTTIGNFKEVYINGARALSERDTQNLVATRRYVSQQVNGVVKPDTNEYATVKQLQKKVDSLNVIISTKGTVTSVGSGYGLIGSVATNGDLSADTTKLATVARLVKVRDSLTGILVNYVPQARIITINGVANDLSDNRSYSVGTVTSVGAGYGLNGTVTTSGTLSADSAKLATVSRLLKVRDSLTGILAAFPAGNLVGTLSAVNGSNVTNLNASAITSGTVPKANLPTDVTYMGNGFNGGNQLLQLNSDGSYPALSGNNIVALDANKITTGTINASILPVSVTLLGNNTSGSGSILRQSGATISGATVSGGTIYGTSRTGIPNSTSVTLNNSGDVGINTSTNRLQFNSAGTVYNALTAENNLSGLSNVTTARNRLGFTKIDTTDFTNAFLTTLTWTLSSGFAPSGTSKAYYWGQVDSIMRCVNVYFNFMYSVPGSSITGLLFALPSTLPPPLLAPANTVLSTTGISVMGSGFFLNSNNASSSTSAPTRYWINRGSSTNNIVVSSSAGSWSGGLFVFTYYF